MFKLNFELANPKRFMDLSAKLLPWIWVIAVGLLGTGLYMRLFVAPPDYQQGETVRMMFIHVPAASMATMVYMFMAASSAVALIMKHPLADMAAKAAAPEVASAYKQHLQALIEALDVLEQDLQTHHKAMEDGLNTIRHREAHDAYGPKKK